MSHWFEDVFASARDEVADSARSPWLLITGIVMPIVWFVVLVCMFGSGLMRDLPVGLIDRDHSAQSRATVQALEAIPSVAFEPYDSVERAQDDLAAGNLYALVVVPEHWSRNAAAQEPGSAIELYLNKTFYAAATTLELDIKTALADMTSEQAVAKAAQAGGGFKGGAQRVKVVEADIVFEGNQSFNYRTYLLATLMPGVLGLGVVLTLVAVFAREWRQHRLSAWLDGTRAPSARLVGKALPWFVLFALYAVGYVAWFAGFNGVVAAGSLAVWCAGAVLLVAAMVAYALFFCALLPSWITALSLAICATAPIYPFTGFSYPLESMTWGAQLFGQIIPLTWFLKLQASQWVLGSPWSYTMALLGILSLFVIVPGALGLWLFVRRLPARAALESTPDNGDDATPVEGFFATALGAVKQGVCSRDTFLIFAVAVAFYLLFYAWPYENQVITRIPTAVVDMDRSATSRDVIRRLAASPAIDLTVIENDPGQAERLYRTARVDGVITLRENFEADWLAGQHVGIGYTANGAFPVKARAVQAAVLGVVRELTSEALSRNLMRAGADYGAVKRLTLQPGNLADQNMYNWVNGYASYVVPLVSIIIVQASLFMAIIMSLGQWLSEARPNGLLQSALGSARGFFGLLFGFWAYGCLWFAYTQGWDFILFDFSTMRDPASAFVVGALSVSAMVALCVCVTLWLNSNAYGAQLLVMISAPAVFLSGSVYPSAGFEWPAQLVATLIPSTPAMIAMTAASQNGAGLASLTGYVAHLAALTLVYGVIAYYLGVRRGLERGLRA